MKENNLNELKDHIKRSTILSDKEKREWLFLLPKMGDVQKEELEQLLRIKLPSVNSQPPPPMPKRPAHFGENEASAPVAKSSVPLQRPQREFPKSDIQEIPRVIQPVKPVSPKTTSRSTPHLKPGTEQKPRFNLAQLQSLKVADLRKALSVYSFLEGLSESMKEIAAKKQAEKYQIMDAFEQSALYKSYLESGLKQLAGEKDGGLTPDEFQAIADFRATFKL